MTIEETKKILSRPFNMKNVPQDILDAHKMAIKALEQEPCEDCISRQKAIRRVKEECNPYGKPTIDFESGKEVIKLLERMPPVQPQPKIGHWIDVSGGCECSECGCLEAGYSSYCPDCGAKMEDVENG